jgi:4-hydroxy-tetrahydrodipicolinate synthase
MSGDDGLTLPLMAAGGNGIISVVTNLIPALMTELVHDCEKGDFASARKIHYRLQPFFRAAFCDGNPSCIKYAMNLKGLPAGSVRLPLVEPKPEAQEIIKKALKDCNL